METPALRATGPARSVFMQFVEKDALASLIESLLNPR